VNQWTQLTLTRREPTAQSSLQGAMSIKQLRAASDDDLIEAHDE
jgi:hypothetical protein